VRALLNVLARLLGRLGFGRRVTHVDAGVQIHVTLAVIDAADNAALPSVDVFLDRPRNRLSAGQTDAGGRLDATVLMRWSYTTSDLDAPAPPPPVTVVLEKTGYRPERVAVDVDALPQTGSIKELDLGSISMARA
jgi:hypothetical protein